MVHARQTDIAQEMYTMESHLAFEGSRPPHTRQHKDRGEH